MKAILTALALTASLGIFAGTASAMTDAPADHYVGSSLPVAPSGR